MSCKKGHKWKKRKPEEVGAFYRTISVCRGCGATKQQMHRKGVPYSEETEEEETKPNAMGNLLTATIISVMIGALVVRCGTYLETHVDSSGHTVGKGSTRASMAPQQEELTPYFGN